MDNDRTNTLRAALGVLAALLTTVLMAVAVVLLGNSFTFR